MTESGLSSVDRALRLLEVLAEGMPLGATDLANRLQTSKATAFRLARSLHASGYVTRREDTRYELGPRCLVLAARASGQINLQRELRWAEEELHETTEETVLLTVLTGRMAVCLDSIPSKQPIVTVATVGQVWPAHAASGGMALLAENDLLIERYLEEPATRHTEMTVTDPDRLRAMFKQIRRDGYAVNYNYYREGVCAVGAAVRDANGEGVAALSVMLPNFRLDETGVEPLQEAVVDVTNRASQRLGWSGRTSPETLNRDPVSPPAPAGRDSLQPRPEPTPAEVPRL